MLYGDRRARDAARVWKAIASWPGHRLPVVAMFTCRVVNAPLAIQPDNIEVSYLLNCGMIVFHAENQQECMISRWRGSSSARKTM